MGGPDDDLQALREKVRWVVGGVFLAGLFLDRLGPVVLGPAYQPWSDMGIGAIIAAILVLFGIESVAWWFKR